MRALLRPRSNVLPSPPAGSARALVDARAMLSRVIGRSLRGDGAALRRAVAEQLALAPGDRVLELGCGDGRLLLELVARTPQGEVVGVERDEWMVRHARARTRPLIERGRVRVLAGESTDLSALPDASFDKACAVDVVYFWAEPELHLAEIRRVLRPGGRLLLGYAAAETTAPGTAQDIVRSRAEVERWLEAAGFVGVASRESHVGEARGHITWTQAIKGQANPDQANQGKERS